METNHPILSSLIKLHADIGGQIREGNERISRLADDGRHVEAVIRLFEPSFNLRTIAQKRAYKGNPFFKHGATFREVLRVLRQVETPLTIGEMARLVLASNGASAPSRKQIRNLEAAIRSSAANYERKGEIVRVGEGIPARWALKG
jgi:hypothetical protein